MANFNTAADELKKATVFGVASPIVFDTLRDLINDACRCFVPTMNVEQAIDLCIPKYHKQTLLDIRKLASRRLTGGSEPYKLHLTVSEYDLVIALPNNMDIPIAPNQPGPAPTCDWEYYSLFQKDIAGWINMAHRMSMAFYTLKYYNECQKPTLSKEQYRYLFHCLPSLVKRALPKAIEEQRSCAVTVAAAWPGKKAAAISEYSIAVEAVKVLQKMDRQLATFLHKHAITVGAEMRAEIVNTNNAMAEIMLLADSKPHEPDGLSMRFEDNVAFHPFFMPNTSPMLGLNPWHVTSV